MVEELSHGRKGREVLRGGQDGSRQCSVRLGVCLIAMAPFRGVLSLPVDCYSAPAPAASATSSVVVIHIVINNGIIIIIIVVVVVVLLDFCINSNFGHPFVISNNSRNSTITISSSFQLQSVVMTTVKVTFSAAFHVVASLN